MNNVEPTMFRRVLNIIGTIILVFIFTGCGVHTVMDAFNEPSAPIENNLIVEAESVEEVPVIETEAENEPAQIEEEVVEEPIIEEAVKVEMNDTLNEIKNPTHSEDAIMLACLVNGEAGGIWSLTEQACVMWTVLNRVDAGYGDTVAEVITAPGQYYYIESFGTNDEYGRDLVWLAEDVLNRWYREKNGEINVGRVLPAEYLFFGGDGYHNYFRTTYEFGNGFWDYSLPSPYES